MRWLGYSSLHFKIHSNWMEHFIFPSEIFPFLKTKKTKTFGPGWKKTKALSVQFHRLIRSNTGVLKFLLREKVLQANWFLTSWLFVTHLCSTKATSNTQRLCHWTLHQKSLGWMPMQISLKISQKLSCCLITFCSPRYAISAGTASEAGTDAAKQRAPYVKVENHFKERQKFLCTLNTNLNIKYMNIWFWLAFFFFHQPFDLERIFEYHSAARSSISPFLQNPCLSALYLFFFPSKFLFQFNLGNI